MDGVVLLYIFLLIIYLFTGMYALFDNNNKQKYISKNNPKHIHTKELIH